MGNICAPKQKQKPLKSGSAPEKKKSLIEVEDNGPREYKKKDGLWRADETVLKLLQKKMKSGGETEDPQTDQEKIVALFDRLDKWEFPIVDLHKLTDGNSLVYMGYAILIRYDFLSKFNIQDAHAVEFLTRIQALYRDLPFHNSTHAANTVHAFHYFVRRGLKQYLNDEDTFACFLSALCIDLDHPGLDNNFQAYSESAVATLYNDLNILENHSSTVLFEMVKEVDMFQKFTKEQRTSIRDLVMDMIIATDKDDHEMYNKDLAQKVDSACEFTNRDELKNLLQVTLSLCDLSHYMKGNKLYTYWLHKDYSERFNQGDLEKKMGLKVTEGCDRTQADKIGTWEGKQIDSLSKVVRSFITLIPRLKFLTTAIKKSSRYWQAVESGEGSTTPVTGFIEMNMEPCRQEFEDKERSKIIPKDQDCVIPHDEQAEKRWKPSDEQLDFEQQITKDMTNRWAAANKGDFKKVDEEPVIYCAVDFDDHPYKTLKDEEKSLAIKAMLDRIDDWDFDVFSMSELLQTHAMYITAHVLFSKWDLFKEFKIPMDTWHNFLRGIQDGYQMNPYHNAMHACDVMQITHSIIVQGKMDDVMTPLDSMAAILSSMVHDLDHPGLNNAYQSHSESYLATIYNNRSILENHHCAGTFKLMRTHKKFDIFQNLSPEEKRDARKTMVAMIISTDMTNHGKYYKLFNTRIEAGSDFKNKKDLRIALQIAIKMADVSNPSRPLYLYLQWTKNIIHEFFMQGDKERDNGLPVSPLMDRHSSVLSRGQIAFMQYIIIPMFKSFTQVFPGMKFVLDLIDKNKDYWSSHEKIEEVDFSPPQDSRRKYSA